MILHSSLQSTILKHNPSGLMLADGPINKDMLSMLSPGALLFRTQKAVLLYQGLLSTGTECGP